MDTNTRVRGSNSSAVVPTPSYFESASQWKFGSFISIDQISEQGSGYIEAVGVSSLYIKKPSDKSSAVKPSGIKIKSGSGTQADPYTFELVYPPKVDVTGVKLDKTTVTIPYGGTETLTATVAPDGAADKTVTWSSSNTDVATVDANGKVTAVKAGTAAITASATNGTADDTTDDKKATCTVTVSKIDPSVKTAPAAIEGLTYNGEPQDLITAGTSDDGTVQYAVVETDDDTPEYTLVKRDSPEPLELSDVKVNTVCTPDLEGEYKGLKGIKFSSGNYILNDISYTDIRLCYSTDLSKYYLMSNKGPLALPEGCDGLLITDIDSGIIYAELVNTANPAGDVQIDEQAWVEVIPKETDAGEYNVYYRVKGDDNHNNTKPVKIEGTKIGKGAPTLTDPKAVEGLVDDGTAKKLVTEGSTEDGQLQYALGTDAQTEPESSTFGVDVPEMTKAGTYYVWYRVIGDTNHTDSQAKCITVTISEKKSDDSSNSDSSKSDSNSGGSNDGANDSSTTPDTGFNGSVTGAAATLMGAAALAAVSVIAAKKKKEDK
ncbi:MAG: Ig domain-containing protein [Ruminococcus sp.]|nr:Ig domain-containing protein [Ruminococcus sp.]